MHGTIGVVMQVALACDLLGWKTEGGVQERLLGPLKGILRSLLEKQRDDGNWSPTESLSGEKDDQAQFCHGAPGFVVSFPSA